MIGGAFALSLHCLGGEEKFGVNMSSSLRSLGEGRVTNGKSKNVEPSFGAAFSQQTQALAPSQQIYAIVLERNDHNLGENKKSVDVKP